MASSGMTMTIIPGKSLCLRCVLEEEPPHGVVQTAADLGVLNTITGLVSAIQSNEVLKLLTGSGEPNPDLLRINIWDLSFQRSIIHRHPDCPACGGAGTEE